MNVINLILIIVAALAVLALCVTPAIARAKTWYASESLHWDVSPEWTVNALPHDDNDAIAVKFTNAMVFTAESEAAP